MKLSAILAPLLDAKVDHDLIRQQILAFEAQQDDALERRRQADADRQARKRERDLSRDVTLRHSDRSLTGERAHVEDKTSNSENTQKAESKQETRDALSSEFDAFWAQYPNKVGKPKARAEFVGARRKAPLAEILAGLARYVASKPADRSWLNPATFLHQERWTDTPATVVPFARGSPSAKASPIEHFRNYAGEINGQERDDRGVSGIGNDAPSVPLGAIEHHR